MDIGQQIEEVANFVDTKSLQESSHVSAVKHNYAEVKILFYIGLIGLIKIIIIIINIFLILI